MNTNELVQTRVRAYYWNNDLNCATTNLIILSEIFSVDIHKQTIDAALGMHGAGKYGGQCGLVEGTLMFLGIIGRLKGFPNDKIVSSCHDFAKKFENKFQTLLCKKLRPEGFNKGNPPHLCEKLTCEAVIFNINFITDLLSEQTHI